MEWYKFTPIIIHDDLLYSFTADNLIIDIKDLSTRYASDVIASCAFGFKVDSMMEENNEFYLMGKVASNFTFSQILKMFGFNSVPFIMNVRMFYISTFYFIKNFLIITFIRIISV